MTRDSRWCGAIHPAAYARAKHVKEGLGAGVFLLRFSDKDSEALRYSKQKSRHRRDGFFTMTAAF
jgi:hypothetical protein